MAVAINMPTRRQTVTKEEESMNPIDMLLKGLDIATRVSGIYTNIQQAKDMKIKQQANEIALSKLKRQEEVDAQIAQGNLPEDEAYRLLSTGNFQIGRPEVVVDTDEQGKPISRIKAPEGARIMTLLGKEPSTGQYMAQGDVYVLPKFQAQQTFQEQKEQQKYEQTVAKEERKFEQDIVKQEKTWNNKAEYQEKNAEFKKQLQASREQIAKTNLEFKLAQNNAKELRKLQEKQYNISEPDRKELEIYSSKMANFDVISTLIENDLAQLESIEDENVKYAQAQNMIKKLNSIISSDAVGVEERRVLAGMIEYAAGNLFNSSPTQFGRDWPGFSELIKGQVKSIKETANQLRAKQNEIYERSKNPLYVPPAERAKSLNPAIAQQPQQQNAQPPDLSGQQSQQAPTPPDLSRPASNKLDAPKDIVDQFRAAKAIANNKNIAESLRKRAVEAMDAIKAKYGGLE